MIMEKENTLTKENIEKLKNLLNIIDEENKVFNKTKALLKKEELPFQKKNIKK